ncbi:MAG: hypothetical protein Q9195_005734 [Heterodermia aff. obscurata]
MTHVQPSTSQSPPPPSPSTPYSRLASIPESSLSLDLETLKLSPEDPPPPPRRFTTTHKTPLIASLLALLVLLTVTITSFTTHTPGSYVHLTSLAQRNALQPSYNDASGGPIELGGSHRCGSNPTQASSLGCVFDLMNFGWVAPECFHAAISSKALETAGPFTWYLDAELRVEVPQEVVAMGRVTEVYTTRAQHRAHCAWAAEVLGLAERDAEVRVPQVLATEGHPEHCRGWMEKNGDKDMAEVRTWARVTYNPCVTLKEVNETFLD